MSAAEYILAAVPLVIVLFAGLMILLAKLDKDKYNSDF